MRQVFKKVRKMPSRDLTPRKIAARVPRVIWVSALAEWLLGQKAAVPQRQRILLALRTAGVRFESMAILPRQNVWMER